MEHDDTSNPATLAQEIYRLLSQSFIRLDTADMYLMRRFGLTLSQSWALVHLGNPQGRSLSELAQLLICDKSNVTGIVDKFEQDGLAVRKRGKDGDRRYTRVILTEQGHHMRTVVMQAREYMIYERLKTLSQQEMLSLHQSLQQLATLLNTQYEQDEEAQIVERAFERSIPVEQNTALPDPAHS